MTRPSSKIGAVALAGSIVTVLVWLIPGEEPAVMVGALTTIAAFGLGYFVSD